MKIAYVFATGLCSTFKLSTMILPQLEQQKHGVQVIGRCRHWLLPTAL